MLSFALKLIHPIITITYLLVVFQFFKIFIPINDRDIHWYLMVVDFLENKLLLLDSLPCPERQGHRRREVLKLVCDLILITYCIFFGSVNQYSNVLQELFLEEMLSHESFKQINTTTPISNFCLVEPRCLPRQRS
jgi:hypothetical protein